MTKTHSMKEQNKKTEHEREIQGHVKTSNQFSLVQKSDITKHCVQKQTFCHGRKTTLEGQLPQQSTIFRGNKKVSIQQSNHVSSVQTSLHITFTPSTITSSDIAKNWNSLQSNQQSNHLGSPQPRERIVKRPNTISDIYSIYEKATPSPMEKSRVTSKQSNQVSLVQISKNMKHCVQKQTFCHGRKTRLEA